MCTSDPAEYYPIASLAIDGSLDVKDGEQRLSMVIISRHDTKATFNLEEKAFAEMAVVGLAVSSSEGLMHHHCSVLDQGGNNRGDARRAGDCGI